MYIVYNIFYVFLCEIDLYSYIAFITTYRINIICFHILLYYYMIIMYLNYIYAVSVCLCLYLCRHFICRKEDSELHSCFECHRTVMWMNGCDLLSLFLLVGKAQLVELWGSTWAPF